MAKDIGTKAMADTDAVTPPNPTAARILQDYFVPRPLFSTEFNLPKPEQEQDTKVLLRSTIVTDALTGLSQFFSNMMSVRLDNNDAPVLATSIFAFFEGVVDGVQRVARVPWEYDEENDQFTLGSSLVEMKFQSLGEDTFVCLNSEGEEVTVSQPPIFRKSRFAGQTIEGVSYVYDEPNDHRRKATTGGETIVEQVIPIYQVNDPIYMMKVAGENSLPEGVEYQAFNVDGRMWGKIADVEV